MKKRILAVVTAVATIVMAVPALASVPYVDQEQDVLDSTYGISEDEATNDQNMTYIEEAIHEDEQLMEMAQDINVKADNYNKNAETYNDTEYRRDLHQDRVTEAETYIKNYDEWVESKPDTVSKPKNFDQHKNDNYYANLKDKIDRGNGKQKDIKEYNSYLQYVAYLEALKQWEDNEPKSESMPTITRKEVDKKVAEWKKHIEDEQGMLDELAVLLPVLKQEYEEAINNFTEAYNNYMAHKDDPIAKKQYEEQVVVISQIVQEEESVDYVLQELLEALRLSPMYTTDNAIKERIDLDLDIYKQYVLNTGNVTCIETYIKLAVAVGKNSYANEVFAIRGIGLEYLK